MADKQSTKNKHLACIILAAGKGTRMRSKTPKVMHPVLNLPIIKWITNTAQSLNAVKSVVVIGPDMDAVAQAVTPCETVIQTERKGTGDAVKTGLTNLQDFDGDILILLGDTPLITQQTIQDLIDARHDGNDVRLSVLGTFMDNPDGYGRLILDDDGMLDKIVEHKDASEEEKTVDLVNTGAFCVDAQTLRTLISAIKNENAQGEYYITDLPALAKAKGWKTAVSYCDDENEVLGINSRQDLAVVEDIAQNRKRTQMMENGVTLQDPFATYFSYDTDIGQDSIIGPGCVFGPGVKIDEDVEVKAFCHLEGVHVKSGCALGPYARLRPGTVLHENVRIGNFVEIKNTDFGKGSKANHLSYIGDSTIGEDVNFGAGSITVNYDGFTKHRTHVGNNVMIGCNVNLIAPINVADGAYIAAGSTIRDDIPQDALSVARSENVVKEGWAAINRRKHKK